MTRMVPYGSTEIIKRDRRGVGDEEGFAGYYLILFFFLFFIFFFLFGFFLFVGVNFGDFIGCVSCIGIAQEASGGEQMRPCDVACIGKVKQIRVVADLEAGLAAAEGEQEIREELTVVFAEDASGAEGTCQEGIFLLVVWFVVLGWWC